MSTLEIIEQFKKLNVVPRLDGDKLKLFGETENLPAEFLEKVKAGKTGIITFLKNSGNGFVAIPAAPAAASYPASNAQQRLWLLSQLKGGSAAYNIVTGLFLKGTVVNEHLQHALETCVRRHESLRTVFAQVDGELKQIVKEHIAVEITFEDIDDECDVKQYIQAETERITSTRFDLEHGPLVSAKLIKISAEEHAFIISMHHIISDGWSVAVLLKELIRFYASYAGRENPIAAPLRIQYKDYVSWFAARQEEAQQAEARAFWQGRFESESGPLTLPYDFARPATKDFRGSLSKFYFDAGLYQQMIDFCRKNDLTLFNFLRSSLSLLLSKYSGQDDITIGTPVSGRNHVDLENQVGLYVNTLPLRSAIDLSQTFLQFAKNISENSAEAFAFQEFPLDRIIELAGARRDSSRNPLFDVLMVLQDTAVADNNFAAGAFSVQPLNSYLHKAGVIHTENVFSKLDLSFSFGTDTGNRFYVEVEYANSLFSRARITQFFDSFVYIISQAIDSPAQQTGSMEIISTGDRNKILTQFNDTAAPFEKSKTLTALFEEQVKKNPLSTALVFRGTTFTFRELDEKSNRLAGYLLRYYHIQADDRVAIMLERSEWLIISILAVLKAGGAYVPIDPAYPQERIDYIVTDAGCKAVLNEDELERFSRVQHKFPRKSPGVAGKSTDLVYVIYTSGSTGKPKGCMLEHRGVVNRIEWMWQQYAMNASDIMLQKTTFTFDVSVWEIFVPLCKGIKMILCERADIIAPERIAKLIEDEGITCAHFIPGMMSAFIAALFDDGSIAKKMRSLRMVVTSGEALPAATVRAWYGRVNTPIHNLYGPTEASIEVSHYTARASDTVIPIGRPIWNTHLYITGRAGELLPVGVVGEIMIGGIGVARGYLNNPALTAEKFIADPFRKGERMYRTGDLGRWLPDGNIEYIGRKDDQVKIRGYRIELGEIESVLQSHASVDAAVVIAKAFNGSNQLLAYVVSRGEINVPELRAYLGKSLPAYMVPMHFMQLEKLPLNANGKIDRKKLPEMELADSATDEQYTAAANDKEAALVAVYEEVLRTQRVGINDDFFALGGDSIKSIQVASRLKQRGFAVTIQDVLLHPVISDLAKFAKAVSRLADQSTVEGMVLLGPVQQAFFESHPANNHQYNQSVLLQSRQPLSEEALRAVLDKLVLHHDALRMVYLQNDGVWLQDNRGAAQRYLFEIIETADDEQFEAHCSRVQAGATLENGPLFRAILFRGGQGGDRLLLVAHHLVIDAVSWRILFEDISSLYQQYISGEALSLPLKTDSFRFWQEQQAVYANSSNLQQEELYWNKVVSKNIVSLPKDNAQGTNLVKDISVCSLSLDSQTTTSLLTQCHQAYGTEINDILITALGEALSDSFGLAETLIKLEGHGRERIGTDVDVTRTVGWFTSMFPVAIDLGFKDLMQQLVAVKETLHRVPNKGIGYGILKYLAGKKYDCNPEIVFNYLGDFGSGINSIDGSELFSFVQDYRGRDHAETMWRDAVLDVSGMVVNGQLQLAIAFSGQQYKQATIGRLLASVENVLKQLITTLSATAEVHLTPVDLTYKELSPAQVEALDAEHNLEDVFALSPLQTGLYFHWLSSDDPQLYFDQISYRLQGQFDAAKLQASYQALVARHAALRTYFTQELANQPLQVVLKNVGAHFVYEELDADAESAVGEYKLLDRSRRFDLHAPSAIRLSVLRVAEDSYEFIWSLHHIVMDGWCLSILIEEFFNIYHGLLTGEVRQQANPKPYSNYINWLQSNGQQASLNYWNEYLSGYDTISGLPAKPVVATETYEARELNFVINAGVVKDVKNLSAGAGITENTFIQAAWAVLLSKYNNTEDVAFGSVVSGRPAELEGVESMIGLFANLVPVRVQLQENEPFSKLFARLQQSSVDSLPHHYTQLAEVQAQSALRGELFDHILMFQNYPVGDLVRQSMDKNNTAASFSLLSVGVFEQTNYDLVVTIVPGDEISVKFYYNANRYDDAQMLRVKAHFIAIVDQMAGNAAAKVSQIKYLSEAEKQQLLFGFNDTAAAYPEDKTLVDLFEEQVAATPENVAVVFEGESLTYRELNERANKLANYLSHHYDVQPDDLVGIQLQRSELLIVCMLAILKSGGAYVPIDPEYPQDRIEYMIADSGCKVVIDEKELAKFETEEHQHSSTNPVHINKPGNVAYVIYTSGTTGKPKGSLIEHRNVVRLLKNDKDLFDFNEHDVWTMFHSFCFDFSVWEIYGAILFGGRVVVIPSITAKDPALFLETLRKEQVTVLNQTPSAFYNLIKEEEEQGGEASLTLRYVIFGGEALSPGKLASFNKRYPLTALINMYGITETTVHVTYKKITEKEISGNSSNIGRPIPTLTCYVLDQHQQLLPIGVAGELYVGGEGVCRGYLNRPELTAKKFIDNPFNPGERLYRSGDKAKLLENGEMEYGGRLDDQVKVRGYRIELGEIETAFRRMSKIENVVIIAKPDVKGDTNLIAYLVSNEKLNVIELRQELATQLPSYMLPGYYVQIEKIPLTSNGKVNRKALPDPEGMGMDSGAEYIAPRNATEEKLVAIWKDILGKERISINDNFFEIGGHSLKATRLVSQLHKTFNVKIALKDIFTHVVLEQQAKLIDQSANTQYAAIEPVEVQADYALSSSQRRLWVLCQIEEVNITYNISAAYSLEGRLDQPALEKAFNALISRHEVLRTVFRENQQGELRQVIRPASAAGFDVQLIDLSADAQPAEKLTQLAQAEFIKPFSLTEGPLLRATLYKLSPTQWVLGYVMHHIISDGWSLGILMNELVVFYNNTATAQPLRIQYKDYAAWQQHQLTNGSLQPHKAYWLQQFQGELPVLELATDNPRPAIRTSNGAFVVKVIDAAIVNKLQQLSHQQGGTLFMGLLSAVNMLLYRYTNQEDIIIGSPVANRQHADLEGQIGFYLNTVALRTSFSAQEQFTSLFDKVRQCTLAAYEHQSYPFDELVNDLQLKRDFGRNPLFDVMVLLQNFNDQSGFEAVQQLGDVVLKKYHVGEHVVSKYDLTFYFTETAQGIRADIEYNSDIFERATIARLAQYFEKLLVAITAKPSSTVRELVEESVGAGYLQVHMQQSQLSKAACSEHQKRLWFIDQFEKNYLYEGSPVYHNLPLIIKLDSAWDIDALNGAVQQVVNAYPVLRTGIVNEASEPFQVLKPQVSVKVNEHTIEGASSEEQLIHQCLELINQPFDIETDTLIRFDLIRYNGEQVFIITAHHLIADRQSLKILFDHISILLKGAQPLPVAAFQYADYTQWQNALQQDELEPLNFYWKRKLANAPVLYLETDHHREHIHIYNAAGFNRRLNPGLSEKIGSFCQQAGVDSFSFFLAVFNALLYRYTGSDEIVIGTLAANRSQDELAELVGPLANLVTLKNNVSGADSFAALLRQVAADYKNSVEFAGLPFEKVVLELNPGKDMSRTALFDVMIHYEETQPGAGFEEIELNRGAGKYDLNLLVKKEEGFSVHLTYNEKYFSAARIERFLGYYLKMLEAVVDAPSLAIDRIDYVSEAEKQQLLFGFNDAAAAYPEDKTLVDLFEEQVAATPENVAVVFEGESLIYRELNERANKLANYLSHHYDVQPDDLVGIQLQRSELLIVCMLAILKSGGAYVPIDPEYPQDRIDYMIADSGCKVVIDENELAKFESDEDSYSSNNPVHINKPGDVAYVIYTSGTTGKPKGSLIEHRNVVRLLKTDKPLFDFNEHDVWTMFHSFCFDFSVWEIYGAILFGGRVVVIPSLTAKDPALFLETLRKEQVTVLNQTPSAFYNLIKEEEEQGGDASLILRYVIFGGEALSPGKLASFNKKYPATALINMYGITETTVHVTYKKITEKEITSNSSNIGRPIPTLTCYVLDQHQQLLPIGVAGELYVGGEGVCRGYLNRPELTAKKFIDNPFNPGERLYRSGDKAKLLENGEMEYGGRLDDQVKVRGYRIELGEIETAFRRMSKIENVVIIAKSDAKGDTNLIAYLVSNEKLNVIELRQELATQLPAYMLPAYYVQIEKIPLTSNGKVNRKALPDPEGMGMDSGAEYVAPRNATEAKLVDIWKEILGREELSVLDNFFEIGGHSLKATRLASQVYKEFGVRMALKDLFTNTKLEEQALFIDQANKTSFSAIEPLATADSYAVSTAQRRLWVLSQFDDASIAYNIPAAFVLEGKFDRIALQLAFEKLIARHESLRTTFSSDARAQVTQHIHAAGDMSFEIAYHDLRNDKNASATVSSLLEQATVQPFDLAKGPLFRAAIIQLADDKCVFSYVMHHIISDGWSMSILVKELLQLYNDNRLDQTTSLPLLRIQYKDYAAWEQRLSESAAMHKSYWLKQFAGELPVLEMYPDKARPATRTYNGGVVRRTIDSTLKKALQSLSVPGEATLFVKLLAAVNVLLHRYTGQNDIIIGTPIAGRQHADLEGQIGLYLNTLALRNQLRSEQEFSEVLQQVAATTMDAFEHQSYPFDNLVEELHLQRDLSRNPLFDVMVILQNAGNYSLNGTVLADGVRISDYEGEQKRISKFDLLFEFIEQDDELQLTLEYNRDIFSESYVDRLAGHLQGLLHAIITQPGANIAQLAFLSEAEKLELTAGFNNTAADFPQDKTLVDLFREQVQKNSGKIALVFKDKSFTWQELHERSNRLANYLITGYGIKADDIIAIKLERSEWMIISILAVIKSGGAYLPVDPEYPQERIDYIIADSGCKTVIDELAIKRFCRDEAPHDSSDPAVKPDPTDLAYVIYTSGSTGNPKGCMLEHRGVVNRIDWMYTHYGFNASDVILQKTTFTFDVSVWELFMPLCWGTTMVLCERADITSPQRIAQLIAQHGVTCLHFVPGMLNAFITALSAEKNAPQQLGSLRRVITSGEALPVATVQAWYKQFNAPIHNLYGPTEASVDVTYFETSVADTVIPIGRPIWNTQLYITGSSGELMPVGAVGEIMISGIGLARGYLNKPALTAEKFIANPFTGGRMYRTGDLGRWLPDGNIEYLGRTDDQVKIRGFRIELGEIETVLQSHPAIDAAVVVARLIAKEKELVAYFVSWENIAVDELRVYMSATLPAYMVPAYFVKMDSFPMNANGKTDRKKLPDPANASLESRTAFVPPRNETEERLVAIWQELTGKEKIGVKDNFFDLGGHSLKAILLATQIQTEFDVNVNVKDVFMNPTIETVSNIIRSQKWVEQSKSNRKENRNTVEV